MYRQQGDERLAVRPGRFLGFVSLGQEHPGLPPGCGWVRQGGADDAHGQVGMTDRTKKGPGHLCGVPAPLIGSKRVDAYFFGAAASAGASRLFTLFGFTVPFAWVKFQLLDFIFAL